MPGLEKSLYFATESVMFIGKIKFNMFKGNDPVVFMDAGDGCHFPLNRYRNNKTGRFIGRCPFRRCQTTLARAVFQLVNGYVQPEDDVHHICDNVWCINPNHLKLFNGIEHSRFHSNGNRHAVKERVYIFNCGALS